MVYKQGPTYLWLKVRKYDFNKQALFDIQPNDKSSRIAIGLRAISCL